jgi:cyclopropane-fatty-acyl-phospholipid synthase
VSHTHVHSLPDSTWTTSVALLDRLFPPPRSFAVRLWDGTVLPAAGEPAFTLTLAHAGALRRMFRPPLEHALGEAFIYGDFDIEGDMCASLTLFDTLALRAFAPGELAMLVRGVLALPKLPARQSTHGVAHLRGALHSRARDRAAIQYHYDVGNDFYALWLDRWMQYSCGYFPTGSEDLDTAQECKLEYLCRKLRLQRGEQLLDIGCGWGGLAQYAAEHYGVRVLGVTLSEQQADYANVQISQAGLGDCVRVELRDYRDLHTESFDKIVSVGMFEHVGRRHLPEYFVATYRLLKPGGLMLNHGIACPPPRAQAPLWQHLIRWCILGEGRFAQRYVFPDGELVPVSDANLVAERAGFEVRDVENLREHYALTLREWVKRLEMRQDAAVALTDDVTYRIWRLYMAGSAYRFEAGHLSVNQTVLAKPNQGKSHLPLTRADLYVPLCIVEPRRADRW